MNPPDNNPKTAVGRLKPNLHAIPPTALIALGLAMENGEGKYGLMNWRASAVSTSVYYDAALRHLLAFWDGESVAGDSHVHHLAHVMACCAILIDAEIYGNLNDDRPIAGPAAAFIEHLHSQRIDAAAQSAMDQINAVAEPELWGFAGLPVIDREPSPWWRTFFPRKHPKETAMPTELDTITAAVRASEAASEKTLTLVQSLLSKIDTLRTNTTDPNTGAGLLALANELTQETAKVTAAEAAGEAGLDADPGAPASTDGSSSDAGNGSSDTTPPADVSSGASGSTAPMPDTSGSTSAISSSDDSATSDASDPTTSAAPVTAGIADPTTANTSTAGDGTPVPDSPEE